MENEKKQLKELILNKSLVPDEQAKQIITTAENGRYVYYNYNKEIVENIAYMNCKELGWKEFAILVQALFPKHLICSGLMDCFVMFNIKDNERVDPPEFYYGYAGAFLNNDEKLKYNNLFFEIMDLFEKNNIVPDDSWKIIKEEYEVKYGIKKNG